MARYKVTFTFSGLPFTGEVIEVNSGASLLWAHDFFSLGEPSVINSILIGNTVADTIRNFENAFRIAYNLMGQYKLTPTSNSLGIEILYDLATIPTLNAVLPTNVTWSVDVISDPLLIESLVKSANATDPCNLLDITVTANHEFNEITNPYSATFADTISYLVTGIQRQSYSRIRIVDNNGQAKYLDFPTPGFLNEGLVELEIVNNTVVVNDSTYGLTLEYSLDTVNWQTENVFQNLSGGDYTIYIKDDLGCQISKTITIIEGVDGVIVAPEPYFRYPKANPLRMALREQWDNIATHKNSYNTLSCEVLDDVRHTEKQRFNSNDIITLQLKTNYTDVKVITSDDDVEQTLSQKTLNLGAKASMDCKIVDLGNSEYGVYFISGNTYDYDTGNNLNAEYFLNGETPQFAKVGNIITINGINYPIKRITFNEEIDANQLVVASSYLAGVTDTIVKAVYNIFNYEVYEVEISLDGREEFNVEIWYGGSIKMASEIVLIDDVSTNLAKIQWSHRANTDMFFSTGIQPYFRVLVDTIKASVKNENTIYETDDDVFQISVHNYEADIIKFLPLTKEIARLLILVLSHSEVNIQGVDYVMDGQPELEALERSNLYVVTATMIVKGTGLYIENVGASYIELPELLDLGDKEFLKL